MQQALLNNHYHHIDRNSLHEAFFEAVKEIYPTSFQKKKILKQNPELNELLNSQPFISVVSDGNFYLFDKDRLYTHIECEHHCLKCGLYKKQKINRLDIGFTKITSKCDCITKDKKCDCITKDKNVIVLQRIKMFTLYKILYLEKQTLLLVITTLFTKKKNFS
ncbi:MAG: hypothetical protein N2043_01445 [Ignavibacterium sp.]|nr:hypothetical protein [Ignavibacterium sp.]